MEGASVRTLRFTKKEDTFLTEGLVGSRKERQDGGEPSTQGGFVKLGEAWTGDTPPHTPRILWTGYGSP